MIAVRRFSSFLNIGAEAGIAPPMIVIAPKNVLRRRAATARPRA